MALVVVTVITAIAALFVLEPKSLVSGLGLNERAVHAESAIPSSSFGMCLRPSSRTDHTQREQVAVGHFQVEEAPTYGLRRGGKDASVSNCGMSSTDL